ncbi:MAG: folate family ECF transporter S component [Eubacteriales bacterium]|nr:folate family ECF transporter S component [Eubacteriales bacterium]
MNYVFFSDIIILIYQDITERTQATGRKAIAFRPDRIIGVAIPLPTARGCFPRFVCGGEIHQKGGKRMNKAGTSLECFPSPFNRSYWKRAASEFANPRTIIIAAMITALRVILRGLSIPLIPNALYISVGFFANALGSMVYGPLVGLASGAISDTLGAFLFPHGDYFFPFIITAMMSSFIFGLFLYRTRLSVGRVILARFSVVTVCNLLLTPIIMRWQSIYFATEKTYKLFTLARTLKNAALFPAESLLLSIFLFAMVPFMSKMKLTPYTESKPKFTRNNIIVLGVLTVVSVVAVVLYYVFYISKK